MLRRLLPIALLLLAAPAAQARAARIPLDPATLCGASIFTDVEQHVARAATAAGLAFVPDPRPLPPQIILTLDTADGAVQQRNGLLFWRGDMLPDQLAPGETGILVRKRRAPGGTWKNTRVREGFSLAAHTNFLPVARAGAGLALPAMIIETSYHLGTLGEAPAMLVLWRTAEEDSAPLGGFIALQSPPPALLDALQSRLAPFASQAAWAAEFDALSR
ncbi:MAG TPA: hypothetical protein DCM68_02135 [Verrucomicrobia bacterium]|nr:hypothetical protein [Verrucomicrobiota bacterium]